MFQGIKQLTIAGVTAVAIGGAVVTSVAAADNVSGGTWWHGVGSTYVYSNFYHGSRAHSSSVRGKYWSNSGWTAAGVTSKASAEKAILGNQAYYGFE